MTRNALGAKAMAIFLAACVSAAARASQEMTDPARLAAVLKKSAEYCRRLDKAALDFVCVEEVTETSRHFTPRTDVFVYDYQFVRKGGEAKERRNLITVNGKKANVRDSPLSAIMFQYKNVVFGPVGLLSAYWQPYHEYKFIGEDMIRGRKSVVIQATPGLMLFEPHCYGKIWLDERDGSVLKIVWDQRSLGNFERVEEWARTQDAEPRITAFSEYDVEKNGLRFPSRSYTELAYVKKEGRKMANSEISTVYRDYKFFTVETEVKF